MSEKKKGLQEGPPIWVESLMTREQWATRHKQFPTSVQKEPPEFFKSDYEWRWNMGKGLTESEIINVNKNLDYLRNLIKR